jgi:2-dehydro-3-deoxygluconokinase
VTVLTVGEAMALLDPQEAGEPRYGTPFTLRAAGAEFNYAIALRRLGVDVAWVSRVGADPLGALLLQCLRAEGVRTDLVRLEEDAPTGLFLKWRTPGQNRNLYYRRHSAATRLRPADVPDEALDGVRLVHLSGITLALGDGPRALVLDLARRARARGAIVTLDPNFRPALWPGGAAEAVAALQEVLPLADWYLCGLEEGCLLHGAGTAEAVVEAVAASGPRAIVRLGAAGAVLLDGGAPLQVAPPRVVDVRDEIGAGDGFAAGFSYGLLQGWPLRR